MENNDEILRSLIKRVYHLEQEVIRLGGQPYKDEVNSLQSKESAISDTKIPTVQNAQPSTANPVANAASNKAYQKKSNVENKIGKNLMGILASVLIFFSLILFAGIAFNYISDIAKVAIMFAISIAIATFGIIKMPKKFSDKEYKYKTFFTTLAACGIGAIYITDLVAYFGFKCISLVPFIISLVIWIAVTMFLSYKCSSIFVYICNIGLVIATLLTAVQFENSLLGFLLYTICLIALYLMNRHEDFNYDCFYFIQYPIVFLMVSSAVETGLLSFVVFAILLMAVFVYANLAYKVNNRQIATNIVTVLLNVLAFIRICFGGDGNLIKYIVIALLIGMMALYFIMHYKSSKGLFYGVYIITYLVSVGIFLTTDMYILIALVPYILFVLLGFIIKDPVIRGGGYFALAISYFIHMNFYESWFVFIFYMLLLILVACTIRFIHYSMVDKYIITGILISYLSNIVAVFELNITISFALFALFAIIMNSRIFNRNYKTGEKEISSVIIGYIMCGVMIISGLGCSAAAKATPEFYQVTIILLITLILCCLNTVKLYKIGLPDMLVGFYLCIKFSLWIYVALHRMNAASYVISIVGILIAITCIILGFSFKQKAFRLYGLIVSLVSVIKLILFDISYDSNILRPVGFFIAGVLCFAISFIYSRLEKTLLTDEK